jgi:hypothetical protein
MAAIQKRKHPRRRVRQPGAILNSDGSVASPCLMLDVSATGARLRLDRTSELPNEFILLLTKDGRVRRRCQIVWRSADIVGIRFVFAPKRAAQRAQGFNSSSDARS